MPRYIEMFERVMGFLESKEIEAVFKRGAPLTEGVIASARERLPVPLPESLIEVFREVGDGFSFYWSDGKPVPPTPEQVRLELEISRLTNTPFWLPEMDDGKFSGAVVVSPLTELVAEHLKRMRWAIEYDSLYDFPYVKDRHLAQSTIQRMRSWFCFFDVGNGDRLCLDTATDPNCVVYDEHDWFDGGTGENGWMLGPTLPAFIDSWSQVCFQSPGWWKSVLTESGVDWDHEEFDGRFRLH